MLLKRGRPGAKCDPWLRWATQGLTMDGPVRLATNDFFSFCIKHFTMKADGRFHRCTEIICPCGKHSPQCFNGKLILSFLPCFGLSVGRPRTLHFSQHCCQYDILTPAREIESEVWVTRLWTFSHPPLSIKSPRGRRDDVRQHTVTYPYHLWCLSNILWCYRVCRKKPHDDTKMIWLKL